MGNLTKPTAQSAVSLREVSAETVRAVCNLKVGPNQDGLVAPNAVSIAQAYFEPKAWFRAIYADETPVGFVMLYDDVEAGDYFLWRYMIDARYQKLDFGRRALEQVIAYVRSRPGAKMLKTSCVPKEGGPEPFYARLGFVRTGEMLDDEVELRLDLAAEAGGEQPTSR
jgi:diamine N-acetyltransferase